MYANWCYDYMLWYEEMRQGPLHSERELVKKDEKSFPLL